MKKEAHETRRKNKIVSALIVAVLMVTLMLMLGLTSSAETYDGMTYTISNCQVTITDCDSSKSGELIIPDKIEGYPVTDIGYDAFADCINLTSVKIPNSVTNIEPWAFKYCTSLTSIEIPNSVTSISFGVFCNCNGLTCITVDEGNSVYDSRNNCNSIIETETNTLISGCKNTVIPDGITSIEMHAFSRCSSLTSIEIPDSVTSIGDSAFSDCSSLTSIDIPDSVTSIGHLTFSHCTDLASVEIPNGVTSIGDYAFQDCTNLMSIEIPNSVISIGYGTFSHCGSLTSIEIPNSVTSISSFAFYYSGNLTSIKIPRSVTSIGEKAFDGCEKLTISGYKNSYAERYAVEKDIPFVVITQPECEHENTQTRNKVDPTCTTDGYSGDVFCLDCEEVIISGELIGKTGHGYTGEVKANNDGTHSFLCVNGCKEYGGTVGCEYSETVIKATCTENGEVTKTCSICGDTKTEKLPATGHADENHNGKCDICEEDLTKDCTCNCHKTGIKALIWKLLCFFYKLFGSNRYCACGKAHY